MAQLIAFDLDGTLAESKMPLAPEMAALLADLLKMLKVGIISGAAFPQFRTQVIERLPEGAQLENLYLLPTNGGALYRFKDGDWVQVYDVTLSPEEKERVFKAFEKAFADTGYQEPEKIYGTLIEDRGSQITFSGLGSEAPVGEKQGWDPGREKRNALVERLALYLPEFSIRLGGMTSIDITKGIDKAYGITQLLNVLDLPREHMLYVGDALYDGGNDAPVATLGVRCVPVASVGETKLFVTELRDHMLSGHTDTV